MQVRLKMKSKKCNPKYLESSAENKKNRIKSFIAELSLCNSLLTC